MRSRAARGAVGPGGGPRPRCQEVVVSRLEISAGRVEMDDAYLGRVRSGGERPALLDRVAGSHRACRRGRRTVNGCRQGGGTIVNARLAAPEGPPFAGRRRSNLARQNDRLSAHMDDRRRGERSGPDDPPNGQVPQRVEGMTGLRRARSRVCCTPEAAHRLGIHITSDPRLTGKSTTRGTVLPDGSRRNGR